MHDKKATILVIIQFTCLFLLYVLALGTERALFTTGIEAIAVVLGLWAILAKKLRVNVAPIPQKNMQLVTTGPYTLIRHPMYTAVLLIAGVWAFEAGSWFSVVVWLILLDNLFIKMNYEEQLLSAKFPKYSAYQKKSRKLIPFIY